MKNIDAAYIAGFVDGEGCFSIANNREHKAMLYVVCTDSDTIQYLKTISGYGKITTTSQPIKSYWKQAFRWAVNSHDMIMLLTQIEPYLVTKKKQCHVMQEWLTTLRGWGGNKSNPLTKKEFEIRQDRYQRMKQLNKRGIL